MSMSTNIIYGKGSEITASNKIVDFIRNHRSTLEEIQTKISQYRSPEQLSYSDLFADIDVKEPVSIDELYEKYRNFQSGYTSIEGLSGVVADVMSKETDVRMDFLREQEEDTEYIVFTEALPWHLNDTEKELTEESLTDIFKKYFDELEIPLEMGDVKLEYCG